MHLNYTLLTSSATVSAASFPFKFHPVIDVDKLQLIVVLWGEDTATSPINDTKQ
ncbi:hypothetical protein [Xenorhabdus szentirmaii]|uniref:hypothetical protein n=1 Tax=Xenorhabdus szentirmaii TaxID=290112 RepID=UPI00199B11D7|nr:hypothetical protein [Xenorhabdus sp. 38]MBD2779922.1 hypothetical protein [Xenorhabdus sp. 38]